MKVDPQINAAPAQRLIGLAPLVSDKTRLLILGSFPGAASLAAQQYYGHPQNQFWAILTAIFASSHCPVCEVSYENSSKWLLRQGLGVWDVYASCERAGSLDSAIRNAEVNDFASLARRCPNLVAIVHNGGESFKHAKHVTASLRAAGQPQGANGPLGLSAAAPTLPAQDWTARRAVASGIGLSSAAREAASVGATPLPVYKLPSTSPANASWNFERKLAAWREVMVAAGLL